MQDQLSSLGDGETDMDRLDRWHLVGPAEAEREAAHARLREMAGARAEDLRLNGPLDRDIELWLTPEDENRLRRVMDRLNQVREDDGLCRMDPDDDLNLASLVTCMMEAGLRQQEGEDASA